MLFAISDFKGAIPQRHARLLPSNFAQVARNTRLEDGALGPVRLLLDEHSLGAPAISIYKNGATWLGWNATVDAAPAPIAANRLYYTGDGVPKMLDAGTPYDLALLAPVAAPTLANLTTPDPLDLETVYYAYTYITGFGEESQPSPLSAALDTSTGVVVRLSAFSAAPGGRNITGRRIYRSQTSALGATELFFVSETLFPATYDHDLAAEPIAEPIPSIDYDPPPATLTGLKAMPNGMMAAFVGKEIYFCEPYQPHAWPEIYTLTVDYDIIGLAVFGSNLAILTTATPYLAQGSHPESMSMEKMDKALPCLSRRAIVDIGYAAYFPSAEGLAMISASDAGIVTRGLFTREQWQSLSPDTFVAEVYNGRYLFTHTFSQVDTLDGGTYATTGAVVDNYDGGVEGSIGLRTGYDFGSPFSAFGEQRLGSIDISGDQPFFTDSDLISPTAMFRDQTTGRLFMLEGDTEVKSWDDAQAALATQTWKSKKLVLSYPTNFGALLIQTDDAVDPSETMTCNIYSDGVFVASVAEANEPQRLPGDFLGKSWEIEITSNVRVSAVAMAHTIEELQGFQ